MISSIYKNADTVIVLSIFRLMPISPDISGTSIHGIREVLHYSTAGFHFVVEFISKDE